MLSGLIGLQRTDNNMDFTTWPQVNMINQKNYYTYVLKSSPHPDPFLFLLGLLDSPAEHNGWQKSFRRAKERHQKCLCAQCAVCEEVLAVHFVNDIIRTLLIARSFLLLPSISPNTLY